MDGVTKVVRSTEESSNSVPAEQHLSHSTVQAGFQKSYTLEKGGVGTGRNLYEAEIP